MSLADLAREHAGSSLTYEAVGATLSGELPVGYAHDDESVPLGHGEPAFRRGRRALEEWAAHRGSGIVVSEGAQVREGETVALAAPLPVGTALGVCRIVPEERVRHLVDVAHRECYIANNLRTVITVDPTIVAVARPT